MGSVVLRQHSGKGSPRDIPRAAGGRSGPRGGRRAVLTPDKLKPAQLLMSRGRRVREAAQRVGVLKTALYEALSQGESFGRV